MMSRFRWFLVALLMVAVTGLHLSRTKHAQRATQDRVAILKLEGEIDRSTVQAFQEKAQLIRKDPTVKVVILKVNSPGGEVTASDHLRQEIERLHVPVVVYCSDMCASGAYWAITARNVREIVTTRLGTVGNIGVIGIFVDKIAGEEYHILTTGKHKAVGLGKPISPEELIYLRKQIDFIGQVFYNLVQMTRGSRITPAGWVAIKDGDVFLGAQAVTVGLADKVADWDEVVNDALLIANSKSISVDKDE